MSFALYAFIFGHGLHLAYAATAGEHADVETMMCDDMPSMCPCNARNLQVNLLAGGAMKCGHSQNVSDMETLPIIKPPTGVMLEQVLHIPSACIVI